MWVKICANTNLDDCRQALTHGADALGFVFAPSARQVTAPQVAAITRQLPPYVETVGVFPATDPAEQIATQAREAGLKSVQLHGSLNLALAERLRQLHPDLGIILTTAWKLDAGPEARAKVEADLRTVAGQAPNLRLLVDAQAGQHSGGLGLAFDWRAAADLFAGFPTLRLIVAGGLRPENVHQAIQTLHPWGVDVASGVEREKGTKDWPKLARFIQEARRA